MVSETPRFHSTHPPRVITHPRARWLLRFAVLGSVVGVGFILAFCNHLADVLN